MYSAPVIETERLILTWPSREQAKGYYHSIIGTDMFDTLHWDGPSGPEDLYDYWESVNKKDDYDQELHLAIINKSTNEYMGGCGLRPKGESRTIINIGYALAPKFHGLGYATEAVDAIVNEGFEVRGAERVYADVFVGNTASRRVLEKLGFIFEGTKRRATLKRGQWLDQWLFAITRPDWEKLSQ